MPKSINEVIVTVTNNYIETHRPGEDELCVFLDNDGNDMSVSAIEAELMQNVHELCSLENSMRPKDDKLRAPATLTAWQVAMMMMATNHIVLVSSGNTVAEGSDDDPIGIYCATGVDSGLYVISDALFCRLALQWNPTLSSRQIDDVMMHCRSMADRVCRTTNRDLVPVANGIFDYATKTLIPYSPEYVFVGKSPIDYIPHAPMPRILNDDGTEWDIESWMHSLSDDDDVVTLLWQIVGAVIRPSVKWNKAIMMFSAVGENGKGTLCELMRGLVGERHCANVPVSNFSKDYALEPLLHANAIITDENDVGDFGKLCANFKAVVTNDVISMNRKYKAFINFRFAGLTIQCINELPKTKDKSDSFYRRLLFVPFEKSWTGKANTAIKDDYVHRPDVLQYVLARILDAEPYYNFIEPMACINLMTDYKSYNDPIRRFLEEMLSELKWDLVPFSFLYELYKKWARRENPSGMVEGRTTFIDRVCLQIGTDNDDGWNADRKKYIRVTKPGMPGGNMSGEEPLIVEYEIDTWYCRGYSGLDPARVATPAPEQLSAAYCGLERVKH